MNTNNSYIDFEKLAENSPVAIYLLDSNGYFKYVNKKMCEISGYSKEELFKMKFTVLIHPDFMEFMVKQVEKRFKENGALPSYDFKGIGKDGRERVLEGHFSLIEIEGEKCILGQVLDITERKKMEIELRRREESLKRVLETSNLGYFEVDLAGNFTYVNESIAKTLGYPKEQLIGMNNRDYTEPEYAKKVYETFNKVYREGKPTTFFDWKITTQKGKEIFVETSVDLIYNEKGEKVGFRGIVRDITEELRVKRELEEREKYYRTIFEGSTSPMFIVDKNKKIIDVNRAFELLSGFNKNEVVGNMEWTRFVDKKDLPRVLEYNKKRIEDPKSAPSEYEFTFLDRWGNKRYVLSIVSVLPDGRFLSSLMDITERKQLEEKLKFISFHDPLTGLYNRYYFEEELSRLENCRSLPVSLIIVDLDGLKHINDNFGHEMGDEYIKVCAGILKSCVRKSDVVARIGGDEFGIILPRSDEITARKVISRINDEISRFNKPKKKEFQVSMSIGFSVSGESKLNKDILFRKADNNMYMDKHRKKLVREYICMR